MAQWTNWSGRLQTKSAQLHFCRSEQDVINLVSGITRNGETLRVAGATHSHATLITGADHVLDLRGLSGIVNVDSQARTAWVRAGTRIYALGAALHAHGLALLNQGDIDEQAIAGAIATGTHGTGEALRNLSASVLGLRIVLANGEVAVWEAGDPMWQASRLNLGAFGVITQVKLQLTEPYVLQETSATLPLADAMASITQRMSDHRHCEFFWSPQTDEASLKWIDVSDEAPAYPVAEEGTRRAWSHEVLPNYRPHKHTEMEYSVPKARGPECMHEIAELLRNRYTNVAWPVEYRSLAADDVWLSTAYERDTITLSVHEDVRVDETAYYTECERIFLAHEGRPHWGKVNYLDGPTLASIHPRWDDWWTARNSVDPTGTFLNDYLRTLT